MTTLVHSPAALIEDVLDLDLAVTVLDGDVKNPVFASGMTCEPESFTCGTLGPRCTVSTYAAVSRCPDCY